MAAMREDRCLCGDMRLTILTTKSWSNVDFSHAMNDVFGDDGGLAASLPSV